MGAVGGVRWMWWGYLGAVDGVWLIECCGWGDVNEVRRKEWGGGMTGQISTALVELLGFIIFSKLLEGASSLME